MVSKEEKNKGGRPKKIIDQELFENLCSILCTEDEICSVLKVTDKTLNNWCKTTYGSSFSDTYKKASATGKSSIRRMQFKLAENNATMAIWLGKQYLGQTDKIETDTTFTNRIQIINDLPSDVDENK